MKNLDVTFSALSDPTRRAILARLARGAATAGELGAPFKISQPAISRHLRVLEEASLIVRERRGQHRLCRLNPDPLKGADDWLGFYRKFWDKAFDRLDRHLQRLEARPRVKRR